VSPCCRSTLTVADQDYGSLSPNGTTAVTRGTVGSPTRRGAVIGMAWTSPFLVSFEEGRRSRFVFGHSFGNRVKLLHITPEPKLISVGIVGTKGRLSPSRGKILAVREGSCGKKIIKGLIRQTRLVLSSCYVFQSIPGSTSQKARSLLRLTNCAR